MKKILSFTTLCFLAIGSFAQNTFPATGNAGVGTSTPTNGKLEVKGTTDVPLLYMRQEKNSGGSSNAMFLRDDRGYGGANTGTTFKIESYKTSFDGGTLADFVTLDGSATNPKSRFFISNQTGYVGIGTNAPASTLDVAGTRGNIDNRNFRVTYPSGGQLLNTEFSALTHLNGELGLGWTALYAKQGQSTNFAGVFNGKTAFVNGNLGLGTTNPINGQLDIKGVSDNPMIFVRQEKNNGGSTNMIYLRDDRGYGGFNTGTTLRVESWKGSGQQGGALANFLSIDDGNYRSRFFISNENGYVGVGTATPNAALHVNDGNNRNYYVDRKILGSTENSSGHNYILLHKIYTTSNLADSYVMGKVSAIRGGTSAWNRKVNFDVSTASAYQSNRGSIINYNEPVRLVTLTHNNEEYVAAEIKGNSALYSLSFTGYANNELLTLVFDQDVSNVQPFTAFEPITFTGKVNIGSDIPATGKSTPVIALTATGVALDKLSGPSIEFASDIGLSKISGIDERNSAGGEYRGALTFHTRYHTGGNEVGFYERMRINSDGNVSIGTTDPKGYRLAVAGKIVSEEVVVKIQGNWPDYVFSNDYEIPSLEETEKFIIQNKHLPGVPSAEEVKESGVQLGDMTAVLLKKIEEMTLLMIEQNKTNKSLNNKIEMLERQLIELKKTSSKE